MKRCEYKLNDDVVLYEICTNNKLTNHLSHFIENIITNNIAILSQKMV